jgi:hypothetical protein
MSVDSLTLRSSTAPTWVVISPASVAASATSLVTRSLAAAGLVRNARGEIDRCAVIVAVVCHSDSVVGAGAREQYRVLDHELSCKEFPQPVDRTPRRREQQHRGVANRLHELVAGP